MANITKTATRSVQLKTIIFRVAVLLPISIMIIGVILLISNMNGDSRIFLTGVDMAKIGAVASALEIIILRLLT